MNKLNRARFFNTCVNWPEHDVPALCQMIDQEHTITRRTFLSHVDKVDQQELERHLGYAPHAKDSALTMRRDWHVSYHRSKLHEETVYYFKHSGIEHVFRKET